MPRYFLMLPALLDFVSATLLHFALNFISPSVYQMMRGGNVIATFIMSILLLNIKIKKVQVLGSSLALLGIMIVGASNILFSDSSNGDSPSMVKINDI